MVRRVRESERGGEAVVGQVLGNRLVMAEKKRGMGYMGRGGDGYRLIEARQGLGSVEWVIAWGVLHVIRWDYGG